MLSSDKETEMVFNGAIQLLAGVGVAVLDEESKFYDTAVQWSVDTARNVLSLVKESPYSGG